LDAICKYESGLFFGVFFWVFFFGTLDPSTPCCKPFFPLKMKQSDNATPSTCVKKHKYWYDIWHCNAITQLIWKKLWSQILLLGPLHWKVCCCPRYGLFLLFGTTRTLSFICEIVLLKFEWKWDMCLKIEKNWKKCQGLSFKKMYLLYVVELYYCGYRNSDMKVKKLQGQQIWDMC